MNHQSSGKTNRNQVKTNADSIETLSSFGKDTVNKIGEGFSDVGKGIFEQLLNNYDADAEAKKAAEIQQKQEQGAQKQDSFSPEGGTVFNFRSVEDERQMTEIKDLIEQIRKEVQMIQQADKALMSEVKDIENLTIQTMPDKAGIYHVRFLEVVLKVLELMRSKISESGMWMQALMSKKAKRGSAFAANTKKKGTQYSMSQELSNARSVQ